MANHKSAVAHPVVEAGFSQSMKNPLILRGPPKHSMYSWVSIGSGVPPIEPRRAMGLKVFYEE